jgi:putative transposase
MFFAFCYFIFKTVLRIGPHTDVREREAEILVLRHQLAVLRRTNPRPRLPRRDRIVMGVRGRPPIAFLREGGRADEGDSLESGSRLLAWP